MAPGAYRRCKVAIRHVGRWICATILAVVLWAFSLQVPGCVATLGPKIGRVIDKDSGNGIADVAVVADGHFMQSGLWQNFQTCTYSVIAYTDKDGNFELPNAFSHMTIGMPYAGPTQWFELTASKSGYVPGDVALPFKFDVLGSLHESVRSWSSLNQPRSWTDVYTRMPNLELKRAELTLKERVALFPTTGLTAFEGCPTDTEFVLQMQSAVRDFYRAEMKSVCNSPPDEQMETSTVGVLGSNAFDHDKFSKRLSQLAIPSVQRFQPGTNYRYRMGDVCEAMSAGDYK
jgi:hypothetical protein